MFERHSIVTATREGKTSALYLGADRAAAEKAYAAAVLDTDNQDVRLYVFPPYTKYATPAANKESIEAEAAEQKAEAERLAAEAAAKKKAAAEFETTRAARATREKELLTAIDKAESALGATSNQADRAKATQALKDAVRALEDFQKGVQKPTPAPAKKAK